MIDSGTTSAMVRWLMTLLTVSYGSFAYGQINIQGKVKDIGQEAVEFANVFLFPQDSSVLLTGTTTDDSGAYELQVTNAGSYRLTISRIGYQDYSEVLQITKSGFIGEQQLLASNYLLEEVTVTAEREVFKNTNGTIIFKVDQSPYKNGFDGLELLQRLPGILADAQGNLSMNGEAPIVQINGRPIQLSSEELINYLSNLNSEDIQSIQIQRHLSANLRGESAGGLVNIILKRRSLGFEGSWRSYYELKRQQKYRLYSALNFNYGADKWNLYANVNYSDRAELYEQNTTIDYFETGNFLNSEGDSHLLRTRPNYRLGFITNLGPKQIIGLEGLRTNRQNERDIYSDVYFSNQGDELETGVNYFADTAENKTNHLLFNYTYQIDTLGSTLKLFADYSSENAGAQNRSSSSYENGYLTDLQERNFTTADTDIKSLQADLEKNYHGFGLAAGMRYTSTLRDNSLLAETLDQEVWLANERSSKFQYQENITAGYLLLKRELWERGFLQVGLRMEHTSLRKTDELEDTRIDRKYINWLPDLLYSHEINPGQSLSLSFTRRLRRPPFWRINNNILKVNDFNYRLGNPDLLPELINRMELVWSRKKQNLRVYHENVIDAINGIYFLEGEIAYYKPFNNGRQIQYGMEFSRYGHLNSNWYINGTFGLYHRRFAGENNEISFARDSYYFNLSNTVKVNPRLSVDVSGYYYSPFEDAFYIAGKRFAVNLFLQHSFWQDKLMVRLYFNDVFNVLVYEADRPFTEFRTTESTKPRTQFIRFQLNYQFSNRSEVNTRRNESRNEARRRL